MASCPPNRNWPKQLGVSRATLREAMRAFEEQGLIRRRQGVGTFVVRHQQIIDTGVEVLESIESIAARMGLQVSMGMLNIEHLEADAEQAQYVQQVSRNATGAANQGHQRRGTTGGVLDRSASGGNPAG